MFIQFNDESKTVLDINYIKYFQKQYDIIDGKYINIGICDTNQVKDLLLNYFDKNDLNKDYDMLKDLFLDKQGGKENE